MSSPHVLIGEETDPVFLHVHAMNDLRFIRETMERSATFTAVPGWGMMMMGTTALMTAGLARSVASIESWLYLWLGNCILACLIGLITMHSKARRAELSLIRGVGWRFLVNLYVPIVVGIPFTIALYQNDLTSVLPSLWLSLYGIGVVTGGVFSIPIVKLMGGCFIALGIVSLFGPASWGDIWMATGFGGLHLLFGGLIGWRHGG